jgi:hypothetical protein
LRQESDLTSSTSSDEASDEEKILQHLVYVAMWTVSASLTISLQALTVLAVLNKSLDPPKTLIVNNRYVRLAPRMAAVPVVVCLPVGQHLLPGSFIGILAAVMYFLIMWEKICTIEHGGAIFEPWGEWKQNMDTPGTVRNDHNDAESGNTNGHGNGGPDSTPEISVSRTGRQSTFDREKEVERNNPSLFRVDSGRSRGFIDVNK